MGRVHQMTDHELARRPMRGGTVDVFSLPLAARRRADMVTDLGGLVAVTTRPVIRMRLGALSAEVGMPAPLFAAGVDDVLESGVDRAILFLDLACCAGDDDLVPVVQTWDAFRPGTEVVAFTPLVDRERELAATVALTQVLRNCNLRVLTASDFHRPEVWRNLQSQRARATLLAELREDFLAAVQRTGRHLPAEPLVLQLLNDAPRLADRPPGHRSTLDDAGDGTPEEHRASVEAENERKGVWRVLRAAGQLPASWLVVIFRVLWYLKLVEREWTSGQIAEFLSFPSPRHLRLTFRRRFGVTLEQLRGVSYRAALRWAAELLTGAHAQLGRATTTRSLIQPLLHPSPTPTPFGPHTTPIAAEYEARPPALERRRRSS